MARGLKLDLIAEGVETRTQMKYLRSQGCREVQGFIFSRPIPAAEFKALLQRNPFVRLVQIRPESEIRRIGGLRLVRRDDRVT